MRIDLLSSLSQEAQKIASCVNTSRHMIEALGCHVDGVEDTGFLLEPVQHGEVSYSILFGILNDKVVS
jgi:hypothetical protein